MSTDIQAGFKQTVLGTIPDAWDLVPLNEICWFQEGPGLRKWQFTYRGMKVINITNLVDEFLDLDKTERHISISEFNGQYQHFAIDENDIVMASSGNSYGKIAVVRGSDLPLMMNTSVIRFKPKERTCFSYLWTYLRSDFFRSQIDLMITGGAQPNFGPFHLDRILVQLPPLNEQISISDALTCQDKIINSLDKLLAKKRDIQQAVRQHLLTGQRRLPGFSGEWELKRLGEIAELIMGQSPASSNYNKRGDGLPLIQGNADIIDRRTIKRIFTTELTKLGKCGDILLSVRAPVGEVARATFDVCLGRGVCAIRGGSEFLYHYLIFIESSWAHLSKGSTFDSVNSAELRSLELKLPPSEAEQTAIATTLSDMDLELAVLEARRDKARQIKQAMMQELLTGRIRLV